VAVLLRFSDRIDHSRQRTLTAATDLERDIAPLARELLDGLWERRVRVRHVGVRLSGLAGGIEQVDFFDDSTGADGWTPTRAQKGRALAGAVDRVRERHGFRVISSARALHASRGQLDPARSECA
jgi:DNA polymerase-4